MKEIKNKQNKRTDLLQGNLFTKILLFAIPLAISSMMQQLFNSADVAIVGKFAGREALAAVGSNSSVINMLINLFVGISVGVNVIVANYIGQRDKTGIRRTIHTSMLVSVVSGVLLMFVGLVLARPILEMMAAPEDVIDLACLYLRIYFIGVPFMMIYNFGAAVLRSMGDTKRPLYILLVSGMVNTVLNVLLVVGFHMSVAGVAIATVVSYIINAGAILYFMCHESDPYRLDIRRLYISKPELKKVLQIGLPAGLQATVFSVSNVFVQSAVNSYGSAAVAGSATAQNGESYTYLVMTAFVQAAVTFTGQNYGAGNIERCKKVFRLCMLLAFVCCGSLGCLLVYFRYGVISLFTSDPQVAYYASIRLCHVLLFQVLASSYEISGGCLRGLGYSLTPAVLTIFGTCVLRLLWVFTVDAHYHSFDILMTVYPLSWIVTGSAVLIAYAILSKRAYRS